MSRRSADDNDRTGQLMTRGIVAIHIACDLINTTTCDGRQRAHDHVHGRKRHENSNDISGMPRAFGVAREGRS